MGTKLPAASAGSDYAGDNFAVETWHLEKDAWQRNRANQGNKTADVLRYTVAGGDPVAGLQPTYTIVSGLSGLDVFADNQPKVYARKFGGKTDDANVVFVFYDVVDSITKQDLVKYESNRYEVIEVDFKAQSGRIEILARIDKSDV